MLDKSSKKATPSTRLNNANKEINIAKENDKNQRELKLGENMLDNKVFINKSTGDVIKIVAALIADWENQIYYSKTDEHGQYPDEITGMMKLSELNNNYSLYDDYVKSTDINDDVIRLIESGVKIKHIQCKTIDGKDIVIKLSN